MNLEGLDLEVSQEIEIRGTVPGVCPKGSSTTKKASQKFLAEFIDAPTELEVGSSETLTITITNDGKSRKVDVWAYAYRGSQALSGEREANKKTLSLKSNEIKKIILPLEIAEDINTGSAKIKAVIQKHDRKTPQEVIVPVEILGVESAQLLVQTSAVPVLVNQELTKELATLKRQLVNHNLKQMREGAVVFVSTTYKTKALALPLLFVVCALVCFMVVFKKF